MTFVAACDDCGEDLKGHEAAFNDGYVVHVRCPRPPAVALVCPTCYMELPATGVCGVCE